jgi:hypothetical protein
MPRCFGVVDPETATPIYLSICEGGGSCVSLCQKEKFGHTSDRKNVDIFLEGAEIDMGYLIYKI